MFDWRYTNIVIHFSLLWKVHQYCDVAKRKLFHVFVNVCSANKQNRCSHTKYSRFNTYVHKKNILYVLGYIVLLRASSYTEFIEFGVYFVCATVSCAILYGLSFGIFAHLQFYKSSTVSFSTHFNYFTIFDEIFALNQSYNLTGCKKIC